MTAEQEKPQVLIVEDNALSAKLLLDIAQRVAPAFVLNTLNEALEYLDKIAAGDSEVKVVLLDPNLDTSRDGSDGRKIMAKIFQLGLQLTVVNTSAGKFTEIEGLEHIEKWDVDRIQAVIKEALMGS